MKLGLPFRIFLLLCLAVLLLGLRPISAAQRGVVDSSSKTSASGQSGRYYALVIGINGYKDFNPLQTARNDATEIAEVLQNRYGFDTKLLLDATRDQILGALDEYRGSLGEEDNLLVYYGGHGWDDKQEGQAYWVPVDGQKNTSSRWINATEITGKAKAIPARHVLIISDSCYSGMLAGRAVTPTVGDPRLRANMLEKARQGKSRHIMASGGDEPVSDVDAPGHSSKHSVFANALLTGLKEITVNEFTASELFNQYVYEQVGGQSRQTPEYDPIRESGHNSGDFVFSRSEYPNFAGEWHEVSRSWNWLKISQEGQRLGVDVDSDMLGGGGPRVRSPILFWSPFPVLRPQRHLFDDGICPPFQGEDELWTPLPTSGRVCVDFTIDNTGVAKNFFAGCDPSPFGTFDEKKSRTVEIEIQGSFLYVRSRSCEEQPAPISLKFQRPSSELR